MRSRDRQQPRSATIRPLAPMCAFLLCAGLVASGLTAGCRDLVKPEVSPDDPSDSFVELVVFGLSSALDEAGVTIDNSVYVDAGSAGQWSGATKLGVVRFVGAVGGLYDISVVPLRGSDTPRWEAKGVVLYPVASGITYPGLPVEVRLDWPELAELGADETDTRVVFRYRLPDPGSDRDPYVAAVGISIDDNGLYAGEIPWEGTYEIAVVADGVDFSLSYGLPDSVVVAAGTGLTLASPFHRQPIALLVGGEPLGGDRVRIVHARIGFSFGLPGYRLAYSLERTTQPDFVYLLPPQVSQLTVSWAEGPAFMPQVLYLSPQEMAPGVVDVGSVRLVLHVVDAAGVPVSGAAVEIDHRHPRARWLTDSGGDLEVILEAGPHRIEVDSPGYQSVVRVVELDADLEVTVVLEGE